VKPRISQYRNTATGELAPSHRIGTDSDGNNVYLVPEGWEPVEPYTLDAEGHAIPEASP
jgi:hypothetical protein